MGSSWVHGYGVFPGMRVAVPKSTHRLMGIWEGASSAAVKTARSSCAGGPSGWPRMAALASAPRGPQRAARVSSAPAGPRRPVPPAARPAAGTPPAPAGSRPPPPAHQHCHPRPEPRPQPRRAPAGSPCAPGGRAAAGAARTRSRRQHPPPRPPTRPRPTRTHPRCDSTHTPPSTARKSGRLCRIRAQPGATRFIRSAQHRAESGLQNRELACSITCL
jgi:hypothetical protein